MRTPSTTLEQWRVLHAVVNHGGYAQAAEALHRSQSSVSYAIARLQEQLGVPLLEMDGRRARLTAHGQVLLAHATELLAGARGLEQLAGSLQQGWEPELRLVVDVAFPTARLITALSAFAQQAPHTRVLLTEVVLSGAEEALATQQADLVIGTRVAAPYLGDLLADIEFVAVAHPEHALHRLGRLLTPEDLTRELQVVVKDSGTQAPRDEGWLGASRRWTVTSMDTSAAMVAGGLGFAWLPRHLVQPSLDAGQLLPLPLAQGQTRRVPLYLVFGQPQHPGPAVRSLAEVLRQAMMAVPGH